MSHQVLQASPLSSPKSPSSEKLAPQSTVTYVYHAKVAELYCNVTATWCKNLTSHSLCITVEKPCQENTCKIDLNATWFWGNKDVYWDFRQAKLTCTPEPCSDYYVALVSKKEVVSLLGDLMEDAYKRTRSRSSLEEAKLIYKKENVCGKGLKEHDIVIETLLSGPNDPEMWISVDRTVAIRIMNLNWSSLGTSQGFFTFKVRRVDWESSNVNYDYGSRNCIDGNCSGCSLQQSPCNSPKGKERSSNIGGFCHFLEAWKTE
ncbi:unnamed protein product [Malus baccata var. baccata]